MQTEKTQPNEHAATGVPRFGFGSLFRDLGASAKNLIRSEVDLAFAELKENLHEVRKLTTRAAVFGWIAGMSIIPFIAFLVLGLGELLDGRYWLSSLIVAVVCAVGGGIPFRIAYRNLVNYELDMSRTKQNLAQQKRAVKDQVENIKDATNATFRRAV